jgi:hypothetical protein
MDFFLNIGILLNKKYYLLMLSLLCCIFWSCQGNTESESTAIETVNTLDKRTYLRNDWKVFVGDNPDYSLPNFNDSDWQKLNFPKSNYVYDLKKTHYFWFRKSFYVSENLQGKSLGYVLINYRIRRSCFLTVH